MLRGQLLLIICIYIPDSSCLIDSIFNAGKEIWTLYSMIDGVTLNNNYDFMNYDKIFAGNNTSREIKHKIDEIHKQLDRIGQFTNSMKMIDSLKLSPSEIMIRVCLDAFELSIESIDESYNEFYQYVNESEDQSYHALRELMGNIVLKVEGENTWIRKILTETYEFLPKYKNIVEAISGHAMNQATTMCDGRRIISEILIHLFKKAMMAELKTSFMVAFGNMYQYSKNEGWKMMNSFAREIFQEQFSARVDLFGWNIGIVDSLYLRSCDPANGTWTRNENFFELEGTFYESIFRYHWGICKYGSCNDMLYVKSRCEPEIYDRRTACPESSGNCIYLNAITACALKSGPYRFQFVNSTELGPLGTNFECPDEVGYLIEDGTGWNSSYATCACHCYSTRNKVSLVLMESDVRSNRVITGLRLVRRNHILHIQLKEAFLSANGHVRFYANNWTPIPTITDNSQLYPIGKKNKTFFLDDLRLPHGYVLTGVKFNKVVRGDVHGFAIEIFGVPFDYENGSLNTDGQYRISRRASNESPRLGINFTAIDSIHTKQLHEPSATRLKYVALKRSSLKFDFGQTTLQSLTTSPESVLGGVGIFYKGVDDYAGLISLRLFGIDYTRYFVNFHLEHMDDNTVLFDSPKRD